MSINDNNPLSRSSGDLEDHDRGLSFDLPNLQRRRLITLLAGTGLAAVTTAAYSEASGSTANGAGAAAACAEIPEETAGPYPADGSNGVDVLTQSGIVRSDIRSSFGNASGVAEGVPLTITLTLTDAASGCGTPLQGVAVYLWHCDAVGAYSLYSSGVENENYLRGVQEADASGTVTFTSIFPGCYPGRWPHVHFEVYPSLAEATASGAISKTSQLALPQDVSETVYDGDGYGNSAANLTRVSLDSDMVFSDGCELQLATVTGGVEEGYVASLQGQCLTECRQERGSPGASELDFGPCRLSGHSPP